MVCQQVLEKAFVCLLYLILERTQKKNIHSGILFECLDGDEAEISTKQTMQRRV